MSRRTFATDPGAGGEESEALGLPFASTALEDWYGWGDERTPNRYNETGDLETDIKSLIKWIGLYSKRNVRSWWALKNTEMLAKKRIEQSKILAQQQAKETSLPSIYGGQFVPPPQIQLSSEINQILQKIQSGQVLIPDWFTNNVNWVKDGSITQDAFLQAYNHQVNAGNIHPPVIELPEILPEVIAEPKIIIDDSINTNMVTQQVINFNIVNGRAVGSIKFVATNNFNPYYNGKNIINIVQFKDPNGANILTTVKTNNLNFTETERDEVISYNEDMQGNTRATVESFVWEWIDKPAGAFSKMYSIEISEAEPPKPISSGFMGAGAVGAIAGLVLLGFIIDHKVSKR
jgi:hypothetical protein